VMKFIKLKSLFFWLAILAPLLGFSQDGELPISANKTVNDTIYLIGQPGSGTGDFQTDPPILPDWEGWTSIDRTRKIENKWHLDTFNAELLDAGSPNNALYCGEVFPACSGSDPPQGYGNGYKEYMDWWGTVTVPGDPCVVTVGGILNYDNEPGYDYLYLQYEKSSGWTDAIFWNGTNYNPTLTAFEPVTFSFPISYVGGDYVGDSFDEVHLRFAGTSDGVMSDADCQWPTSGLAQIDNVTVIGTNGLIPTSDDFESGMELSNWQPAFPLGAGDYAKIWPILDDLDPIRQNNTPQVAFIDDGIVEDCDGEDTDGYLGSLYTYGPDGYCVNFDGGCFNNREFFHNEIWSPVFEWPEGGLGGAELSFDAYGHIDGGCYPVYFVWSIKSRDQAGQWNTWQHPDRNEWMQESGYVSLNHEYHRFHIPVKQYLVEDPSAIQIALGAWRFHGFVWEWEATPAPYFDNVAFRVFPDFGQSADVDSPRIQFFASNHPNPFNPSTQIEFSVPSAGQVTLKIFNLRGKLVRSLVDEYMPISSSVTCSWNGLDNLGSEAASGVYYCEIKMTGNTQIVKMALIK
jgi:hypothetical protein